MAYENEIAQIKERLLQIESEIKQPNANTVKLKNEYKELIKKLNYLELEAIKEILISEYYASKEAMDKAAKNLEEAGIILEQEEKAKKSINNKSLDTNRGIIAGLAFTSFIWLLFKK